MGPLGLPFLPIRGVIRLGELIQEEVLVTVEVVEDRRIPSSTDLMSTYEAELDGDGELMSYRRTRRYPRGRGDAGEV